MNKWVSGIHGVESEAIEQWSIGLSGLTGENIKLGLERCRDLEWPPSIKEFRSLCIPEKYAHRQNASAYEVFKQLPKPETDKDKAKVAILEAKKALRGGK